MDGETIALLIKWGPIALVAVIFLWFFLIGVIRGSYKVTRRLIYVVAYIVLLWFFMGTITNTILDLNITINGIKGVRNFIVHTIESNETINDFLSYSPNLKGLIIESPQIIINPILFMVLVFVGLPLSFPIYWIYLIIYNLIAKHVFHRKKYEVDEQGNILRNDKGKKIKVKRKKHRLLGGLLRGAQAVVTFSIILLPVNFVNRIYNKAKSNAEIATGKNFCDTNSSLEKYRDICGYIDMYNDTIFGKLGGEKSLDKIINDRLTTVEYNDKKVNLENELSTVAISAVLLNESGILDLFKDGEFNLEEADFSLIKFDKLDKLVDTLFSSTLISEVSDAGLKYVMHEVAEDKLVDLLKDDDIVSKIEYKNVGEIEQELRDVIAILKFSVEKGLVDSAIDNKDNAINIVNNVNEEDVETLVNKILSLKILNRAMPSALSAYGEKHGIEVPETMTEELNGEVASLLSTAIKFVKTMEITDMESLTEGDLVENLGNALFVNGAMKDGSKDSLATLLHDLNSSYLFKNVLSTQINKMLEDKDYKVDGRVLKYVDTKEKWVKELEVLDNVYALYDKYEEEEVVDYSNVTALLNDMTGTKVMISVLPFAYSEILPEMGIEIDAGSMPEIDFDGENEESTKEAFYTYWGNELSVLNNVAEAIEILELQSLEDVDVEMLKSDVKVDALSTIMGSVYESKLLKEPFIEMMTETINEFVIDFDVEFTTEELEKIDNKDLWKNEFTNISNVLDVDLEGEDNINGDNLEIVFDSIGNMKLFDKKKVQLLKYAVGESGILENVEDERIPWPNSESSQEVIDTFWDNETSVLLNVVDKKDTIESLEDTTIETMNADEIGGLLNEVMKSNILSPTVVDKISELLVDNGVIHDLDEEGNPENLKASIKEDVNDWAVELTSMKEIVDIDYDNMGEVIPGEDKNAIEKVFDIIEESKLLQNTRANILLKAVNTIELENFEVSSDIDSKYLRGNDASYVKYEHERDVIINVSKNKDAFDDLENMELNTMDTASVGGLLDTLTKSEIFGDYVVNEISELLVDNGVKHDLDQGTSVDNLKNSIKVDVDDWKAELDSIKEIVDIDYDNMSEEIPGEDKNAIEKMFDIIEESKLLENTRANILLKAVNTIELEGFVVPSNVKAMTLRGMDASYTEYGNEKSIIINVSKNKDAFDDLANGAMALASINTSEVGGLLNTVTDSIIFGDYVEDKVVSLLYDNDIRDDGGNENKLRDNIAIINDNNGWTDELNMIQNMLTMTSTSFAEVVDGKTRVEKTFEDIENSVLLGDCRASILIKSIKTINLEDVQVPNGVNSHYLRDGGSYVRYDNEKNVFITFAENKDAVEGLTDITELTGDSKKAMGNVLDAMKLSEIFKVKYNKTLDTALSSIRNNEYLVDYGVTFSSDYSNIIWSSTYDSDGVTVIKNGEIDNLLIIKNNIESVAGYVPSDLLTNKSEVIAKIGMTLDAVSASALLGDEQADKIADTVIATLTVNVITNITKDSNKTWTQAFDEALSSY